MTRPRLSAIIATVTLLLVTGLSVADVREIKQPDEPGWVVLDERPGDGEQCLVCRKRVYDEDIIEIRYRGRTLFVGRPFMGDFEADPERYFARLQARSALFDEEAMRAERPMALGWLWLGGYVLAGLIFAALCGYLAVCRGLRPLPWFFAGLFGNVAAFAMILFVPRGDVAGVPRGLAKVPTTRAPAACPSCGAANHPSGRNCADCGAALTPSVTPEAGAAS